MVNNSFTVVIEVDDRHGSKDSGKVRSGRRKDKKEDGLMICASLLYKIILAVSLRSNDDLVQT